MINELLNALCVEAKWFGIESNARICILWKDESWNIDSMKIIAMHDVRDAMWCWIEIMLLILYECKRNIELIMLIEYFMIKKLLS